MTREEMRFHAACAAMQGWFSNPNIGGQAVSEENLPEQLSGFISCADKLLAKLAETAPKCHCEGVKLLIPVDRKMYGARITCFDCGKNMEFPPQ